MSKRVKGFIEQELKNRFEGVSEFVVVSLRGIPGIENNQMRGELLQKNIRLTVVRNSLAARACSELGMGPISELFSGPTAVAIGADDIVELSKELADWDKKLDRFEIKGAFLEGKVLDAEAARALAKMPSRTELQATVVMIAKSPGARLAGAITAPAGVIAGCIKSLIEKREEDGE